MPLNSAGGLLGLKFTFPALAAICSIMLTGILVIFRSGRQYQKMSDKIDHLIKAVEAADKKQDSHAERLARLEGRLHGK